MVQVKTTLQEDFEKIGLPVSEGTMTRLSGVLSEDVDEGEGEYDDSWLDEPKEVVSEDNGEEGGGEDGAVTEGEADALDGPVVTNELFDRIEALPFDTLEAEDFEALLGQLSEKEVPDDDEALVSRAGEIVKKLKEGVAARQRRFKSGSTARKVSFQCPSGQRAVDTGASGGKPQCRPSHIVAGGMGKLNKESRKKTKWARGGKGRMSAMRSGRVEKRRKGMRRESEMSPFAMELMQVTEGVNSFEAGSGLRDEVVGRMVSIIEFLNEEFCDESVAQIYDDAVEGLIESYEHGRLDEDVINDADFIKELNPVIELIVKSFAKVESEDGLGNE